MTDEISTAAALFRPNRMTVGLMLPVRSTVAGAVDLRRQLAFAGLAEDVGFDALWVRDVPLNGAWYPESFGHPDPFAMLGAVAAATRSIAIGTAATVLTLRHPLHVAKSASSLDHLSNGRFVLGLGSGDRPEEFAAFGVPAEDAREIFQRKWIETKAALEQPGAIHIPDAPQQQFELRPPPRSKIPMIAIGSSGQTLEWIARNADGWATYFRAADIQRDRHAMWRRAVDGQGAGSFRSFSVAMGVELQPDSDAPAEPIALGLRIGARALAGELTAMAEAGAHHVILSLTPNPGSGETALEAIGRQTLGAMRHSD